MSMRFGLMSVLPLAGLTYAVAITSLSPSEPVSPALVQTPPPDHTHASVGCDYPIYETVTSDPEQDRVDLVAHLIHLGSDASSSIRSGVGHITTSQNYNDASRTRLADQGTVSPSLYDADTIRFYETLPSTDISIHSVHASNEMSTEMTRFSHEQAETNLHSLCQSHTQEQNKNSRCQKRLGKNSSRNTVTDQLQSQSGALSPQVQFSAENSQLGSNKRKRKCLNIISPHNARDRQYAHSTSTANMYPDIHVPEIEDSITKSSGTNTHQCIDRSDRQDVNASLGLNTFDSRSQRPLTGAVLLDVPGCMNSNRENTSAATPIWLCYCGALLSLDHISNFAHHLISDVHCRKINVHFSGEKQLIEWFFNSGRCRCGMHVTGRHRRYHISTATHLSSLYRILNLHLEYPNIQGCPLCSSKSFSRGHKCHLEYGPDTQATYFNIVHRVVAKMMERWPDAKAMDYRTMISIMMSPRYSARGKFIQLNDDVGDCLQSIYDSLDDDPDSCRFTVHSWRIEKRLRHLALIDTETPSVSDEGQASLPINNRCIASYDTESNDDAMTQIGLNPIPSTAPSHHPLWLCQCGCWISLGNVSHLDKHLVSAAHWKNMGLRIPQQRKIVDWFIESGHCRCGATVKSNRKYHITTAKHLTWMYLKLDMHIESTSSQRCPLCKCPRFFRGHFCPFQFHLETQSEYLELLKNVVSKIMMRWPDALALNESAILAMMTSPRYSARGKFIQLHDDITHCLKSIEDSLADDPDSCRYTLDEWRVEKRLRQNGAIQHDITLNAEHHDL